MLQIAPNIWSFTGLMVGRVYLIADPDGLTLVDTSIPPSGTKILNQLKASGHRPSAVKRILITHAHPDHVGSLHQLQAATGAQVLASAAEQQVIEGKIPIPRIVDRSTLTGINRLIRLPETWVKPPVSVTRVLADGDVIAEVMGGLTVVATPGHAPGHIAFWQPEKRILICGDVIFHLRGMTLPAGFLTVDMAENKRSIAKIAKLEADTVCFGHGQPVVGAAAEQIKAFARRVGAL